MVVSADFNAGRDETLKAAYEGLWPPLQVLQPR